MGKLSFRYGVMGSGKSTELLQMIHNYQKHGLSALTIKPERDRDDGYLIQSRLGISKMVDYCFNTDSNMLALVGSFAQLNIIDCLIIDEAQFLTVKQVEDLFKISIESDLDVLCYGLKLDFTGKCFAGSGRLLELANEISEIETICSCGAPAKFNIRMVNGQPVFTGEQVVIDNDKGGTITYKAVCPRHFHDAAETIKLNGGRI